MNLQNKTEEIKLLLNQIENNKNSTFFVKINRKSTSLWITDYPRIASKGIKAKELLIENGFAVFENGKCWEIDILNYQSNLFSKKQHVISLLQLDEKWHTTYAFYRYVLLQSKPLLSNKKDNAKGLGLLREVYKASQLENLHFYSKVQKWHEEAVKLIREGEVIPDVLAQILMELLFQNICR